MNGLQRYLSSKWEYWPESIQHFPTIFIYLFFSLRSRSFLFFTNVSHDYKSSNIENSSKNTVYSQLPPEYHPKTVLVRQEDHEQFIHSDLINELGLHYPIIVKPNVGKRGFAASLIHSQEDLVEYFQNANYDVIVQEYIDAIHECGIFYIRHPDNGSGRISSIGIKTLPAITGDGKSTLTKLLEDHAIPQPLIDKLSARYDLEKKVLYEGERLVVEPIGSHNRGAKIVDANHLISEKLVSSIESALSNIELYYGRLDIKYESWEGLLDGQYKIIEINTITSEPLCIYDINNSIAKKYKTIYHHLAEMYHISRTLRKAGNPVLSIPNFLGYIKNYRTHLKKISPSK